jgi:hypothetical protein
LRPRDLLFTTLTMLLSVVLLASCTGAGKPESGVVVPEGNAIRKEYRRGPFCVRLLADKESLSIAESLLLTIEAEVEEGFEAELPRFGEKLGEFGIRDYREEAPRLTPEKKITSRRVYTLEPFLSGDYTIAPMRVRFRKQADTSREDQNGTNRDGLWAHEISTEEITVKVNSLLEKEHQELALNPIRGPVALPAKPFPLLHILLAVGVAGLAGGGAFLVFRRKRTAPGRQAAPALPPHELAYRQLQELLDEKLIERGENKLFFSKLSDVLRGYIENRFGIQAPRRTTEEFLASISRDADFSAEQQGLLMAFLWHCDLVKFAEHAPSTEEVTRAIDSCRAFIDATREDAGQRGDGETRGGGDVEGRQ